jgi:hypothetical protein
MSEKIDPTKCVNCGTEVWLGAFFSGPFLCDDCLGKAARIILSLKKRLAQEKSRKCILCKKHAIYHICKSCADEIS